MASFTIRGGPEMRAKIAQLVKDFPKKVGGAMYRVCDKKIMTRAKDEFCPFHLGVLRGTGLTDLPEINGNVISVTMGFGGPAAPYALAVHEHLSEASPPSWRKAEAEGRAVEFHPTGHGPEYLKKPLLEEADTFLEDVVKDLRL